MRSLLCAAAAALLLAGCAVTPPMGEEPAKLLTGPIPVKTSTPITGALRCLAHQPRGPLDVRLAVGDIPDRTGRFNYQDIGAYMTQGATHMMISALAQAGTAQVNRSTTAIAEFELAQSLQQRLGEGRPVTVGNQTVAFRPVAKGTLLGSTHYITGAISELDFKVVNSAASVTVGGIGGGAKSYAVQIGLDLAVTDTRTSRIVYAKSWRKQAIGYETSANLFRFFDLGVKGGAFAGDILFDVSIGEQPTEPLQGAVRWAIESAAYDIVSDIYRTGTACDHLLTQAARERREAELADLAAVRAMQASAQTPAASDAGEPLNKTPADPSPKADGLPSLGRPADGGNCRYAGGRMICDPPGAL